MKIVAAVFADFSRTFLDAPSRLQSSLRGRAVLVHTLRRVLRVEGLESRFLVVRDQHRDLAAQVCPPGIECLPIDSGVRSRRGMAQSARKWNLHSWRGGLASGTWFDEFLDLPLVGQVLATTGADAVLAVEGHQAVLDPRIASAMLLQARDRREEARFIFTAAPPGLAPLLLTRAAVAELLEAKVPFGVLLTYRPEFPATDPVIHPTCLHVDNTIAHASARFLADTRIAFERLDRAIGELGESADATALCRWSARDGHDPAGPLPAEVELELTTDTPLDRSRLSPPLAENSRRVLTDPDAVMRLAGELAQYDDRLVVLGGAGDPLVHPQFVRILRGLRAAGICGLAVRTSLLQMADECLEALFETKVDVLQVRIDSQSRDTYRQIHGIDGYADVLGHIERIENERRIRNSPQPLLAPSFTKCAANLHEMEVFFDAWIKRCGSAVLEGFNDYCGLLPPDTLLHTEPPFRGPCRRLPRRLMLLADGTVARCAQDVRGEHPIGDWRRETLAAIWSGTALAALRQEHARARWKDLPLCGTCREWFRP